MEPDPDTRGPSLATVLWLVVLVASSVLLLALAAH